MLVKEDNNKQRDIQELVQLESFISCILNEAPWATEGHLEVGASSTTWMSPSVPTEVSCCLDVLFQDRRGNPSLWIKRCRTNITGEAHYKQRKYQEQYYQTWPKAKPNHYLHWAHIKKPGCGDPAYHCMCSMQSLT
jgi:hypothetical protein